MQSSAAVDTRRRCSCKDRTVALATAAAVTSAEGTAHLDTTRPTAPPAAIQLAKARARPTPAPTAAAPSAGSAAAASIASSSSSLTSCHSSASSPSSSSAQALASICNPRTCALAASFHSAMPAGSSFSSSSSRGASSAGSSVTNPAARSGCIADIRAGPSVPVKSTASGIWVLRLSNMPALRARRSGRPELLARPSSVVPVVASEPSTLQTGLLAESVRT
mmetsp:Transcript_12952/g.29841  ORF Transcript_12952/g.29841 Transcript_12952/m.29841 type:complete len:221 (+) Transcript_12952:620-1282(+)